MVENFVLLAFIFILIGSVIIKVSLIWALLLVTLLFYGYGRYCHLKSKEIFKMGMEGVKSTAPLLVIFMLIGVLTALWRASGTIPYLIYQSAQFLKPKTFLLVTFLMNALLSSLIGTSLGTASTAGVICMTLGKGMNIPPAYVAGAVLSGAFVGDRCSYMSSSALLVANITGTNIRDNVVQMMKTAIIPLFLTSLVYGLLRFPDQGHMMQADSLQAFESYFIMSPILVLPAVVMLILPMARVNISKTMLASSLVALLLTVLVQKVPLPLVMRYILLGFHVEHPHVQRLLGGAGIISVWKMMVIISISSSYFGIFRHTPLLVQKKAYLHRLEKRIGKFTTMVGLGSLMSMLSCNQTLSTMLTFELGKEIIEDNDELAQGLEDTSIILSGLIPWNIACALPLGILAAPPKTVLFAAYLYVLPLCRIFWEQYGRWRRRRKGVEPQSHR